MEAKLRIREIEIAHWRNLEGVSLKVPPDQSLVCLVGENGTGKSSVLELLTGIASEMGLTRGVDIGRGSPFEGPQEIRACVQITDQPESILDELPPGVKEQAAGWDGSLTFERRQDKKDGASQQELSAGGCDGSSVAAHLKQRVAALREISYLYLDSDRAYPRLIVEPHKYGSLLTRAWDSIEDKQKSASKPTRTLYEDWINSIVAREGQVATRRQQASRRALREGSEEPAFEDPFADYRESVNAVLPHLQFSGVDSNQLMPLFDTTGAELSFSDLSGGEREIAFLVGQIDRFRLRKGLLLVDEPELHLNPDLLRTWLAFIRDTILDGQVWIATHSLEAVEVAGPEASFILERGASERTVATAAPLTDRPIVAALSAAIGSPAFSLERLRFVFVEGERQTGERERFHRLCGEPAVNRFMEAGNGRAALAKLRTVRELADEAGHTLAIGAVLDRDFKSESQVRDLESDEGVHVLACHEIENLFLDLATVQVILGRNARDAEAASDIIRAVSDRYAGLWIFQNAAASAWSREVEPGPTWLRARDLRKAIDIPWESLGPDAESLLAAAESAIEVWDNGELATFRSDIEAAWAAYAESRETDDLWRTCLGKQVMQSLPGRLGLSGGSPQLQNQVLTIWAREEAAPPDALVRLRKHVSGLHLPLGHSGV